MRVPNKAPTIVGFDPGFANFGFAVANLEGRVSNCGVFRTKKADKKHAVYASDDNAQRIRELTRSIATLLNHYRPVVIAIESQSWPRNASAATKVAMSWGMVVALAEERQIPMIQITPQNVKVATVGHKKASKEEVKAWAIQEHGSVLAASLQELGALYEHAADACAILHAARTSDIFRAIARA